MTREEKVKIIKSKIKEQIKEYRDYLGEIDQKNNEDILDIFMLLAIERYFDQPTSLMEYYNDPTNYIVSDVHLDMMIEDRRFNLLKQIMHTILEFDPLNECNFKFNYDNVFFAAVLLCDRFIDRNVFTIFDDIMYKKRQNDKNQ